MNEEKKYYVYLLKRLNGEPFYVGYGHHHRWHHHEMQVRAGKETNHHKRHIILQILAETGERRVPKEKIAEGLTKAEAVALEIATIAKYGRYPDGPLVNMTSGGDGCRDFPPELREKCREQLLKFLPGNQFAKGMQHTDETKRIISATSRAYWDSLTPEERKRGPMSDEHRATLSAAFTGRKFTDEHKAKIGAKSKGNAHWLGKTHSEETLAFYKEFNGQRNRSEAQRAAVKAASDKRRAETGHAWTPEQREAVAEGQRRRWARYNAEKAAAEAEGREFKKHRSGSGRPRKAQVKETI